MAVKKMNEENESMWRKYDEGWMKEDGRW